MGSTTALATGAMLLSIQAAHAQSAEGADPVAIAKAAGFAITTEDLNTHRQTLSDDELEGVAGGSTDKWCTWWATCTC